MIKCIANNLKIFIGVEMNGWKLYGLWIFKKYYFGFSIAKDKP